MLYLHLHWIWADWDVFLETRETAAGELWERTWKVPRVWPRFEIPSELWLLRESNWACTVHWVWVPFWREICFFYFFLFCVCGSGGGESHHIRHTTQLWYHVNTHTFTYMYREMILPKQKWLCHSASTCSTLCINGDALLWQKGYLLWQ